MKRTITFGILVGVAAVGIAGFGAMGARAAEELSPALAEAERDARKALNDFFDDFNAADNDALQDHSSYPHAFVGSEGSIRVIEDRWESNFDAMREREDWHHSTLDSARAFLVKEDKVHFEIVFSRHNTDGERYRTVPGLWIMTKQDGQWGLTLRSY